MIKRPILWWAVCMMVGIVLTIIKQLCVGGIFSLLFIFWIGEGLDIKRSWLVTYSVTLVLAGVMSQKYVNDCQISELAEGKSLECIISGRVNDVKIYEEYQKIYLDISQAKSEKSTYSIHGVVINDYSFIDVEKGGVIEVKGILTNYEEPRNEGQFDIKSYYRSIGMDYKMTLVELLKYKEPIKLIQWTNTFRGEIGESFELIDDSVYSGIYKAMVIGDKENLNGNIKDLYQAAGISHILAISGLHISIIGMALYKLLKRRGCSFAVAAIISGTIILNYGFVTGNSISTIRAAIMFCTFLGAQILGRTYDMLSAVSLSAMIILTDNPLMITNAGFQLSFAAIIGIAVVVAIVNEAMELKLMKGIATSLAISIVTAPIITYNYFQISMYSVFLNILVVPMMGLVMTGAILGGLSGIFSIVAGKFFIGISHYIVSFYNSLCSVVISLPGSQILTGKPEIERIIAYYLILGFFLWLIKKYHKISKILVCMGIFILFFVLLGGHKTEPKVVMLDVGQGDCIYVSFSNGENALVDCGSSDIDNLSEYRIIPYLKANRIKVLNYIFVSHMDQDHISGINALLQSDEIRVECIVVSYVVRGNDKMKDIEATANRNNCRVIYMEPMQSIQIGDETVTNVFPVYTYKNDDSNENSMVLDMKIAGKKLLFTGDIGIQGEEHFLKVADIKEYDVLKVAHHGSKNSSSVEFLNKIMPKIAIISAGINNAYGHPAPKTVDKLKKLGTKVYITAYAGQITVTLEDERNCKCFLE